MSESQRSIPPAEVVTVVLDCVLPHTWIEGHPLALYSMYSQAQVNIPPEFIQSVTVQDQDGGYQ